MQRAWKPQWNKQLNWKLLQMFSLVCFSQSLEIVGYDFENILQTQKFAMTERTNEKLQILPMFYPMKESVCQKIWWGHKARLLDLGDFEFNAPIEGLNKTNVGRTVAEFFSQVIKNIHEKRS